MLVRFDKAKKKLNVAKLTPAQRRRYNRFLDEQRGIASHNQTVQKDIDDAKKEGKLEGKYEVAENLLREGVSVTLTVKATGLPENVALEIKRRIDSETPK